MNLCSNMRNRDGGCISNRTGESDGCQDYPNNWDIWGKELKRWSRLLEQCAGKPVVGHVLAPKDVCSSPQ